MKTGTGQSTAPRTGTAKRFSRPWTVLFLAVAIILVFGTGLMRVEKDPSVDAFVPQDHPAAIARDRAAEVFGLEDPVIIGLAAPTGESAFTPARLDALRRIEASVRILPGVRKTDVVSLASEKAISGAGGDLAVDPIVPAGPLTSADAAQAETRFRAMPMMEGLLASASGDFLTVVVPVDDPNHAADVVTAITEVARTEAGDDFEVHIAGVSAMNARLSSMVDSDTKIFVPAAVLTVLLILFLSLRRFAALVGPLFVIAGSAAIAIGLMGWLGAKYYLITTALPVVIMAIAVADTLHISTFYMRARRRDPKIDARGAVAVALRHAMLPVFLTSVTTVVAFCGLSFGAAMKPISEFGLFAAAGVAAACVLSLTALPAILVLTDLKPSPDTIGKHAPFRVDRAISSLTRTCFDHPRSALALMLALTITLGLFASRASFDYERQRYFTKDDAVRQADQVINDRLGGVNFLDVVVTAPEPGGIMTPETIAAIASLRAEVARLPHVVKVSGIDQYIGLMHEVLTGDAPGSLPTGARAPAQYMFLYEASAPPDDFKQEVDYSHTEALVRAQLSTDGYQATLPTVRQLETILENWSAETGLKAEISGRVAVNDGWMSLLAANHFRGLGLAITLVFLTSLIVFRSLASASLAMVPVAFGVLSVYAVMGAFGIDIAPATSMTAAISTGLGVDFGIHLISHLRRRFYAGERGSDAFAGEYVVVARACFYSALALGVALAVICISSAPPLRWFGLLISVGALGSLIGALIILPGLRAVGESLRERKFQHV